jgi:outer membrane usher protein
MRLPAFAVALLLSGLPLVAQPTPEGTAVVFPLRVNTVMRGEAPMVIADDGRVWMQPADLEALGVSTPEMGGRGWVDLGALAPTVEYRVNEERLELELTVDPRLLGTSQLRAVSNRPRGLLTGNNPSAFLNYGVTSASGNRSAALELGVTRGAHLVQSDVSVIDGGDVRRGLTHYRYSDRERMREWTLGDRALGRSLLGGRPVLSGFSVSRNFGLDPYFVRTPTLGLEALAQTPSEVEVYVNGLLVRRERVQPGQVRLEDLPVAAGSGNVQIVVRDAFGREVVQDVPYYLATETLRKGLWEYDAGIGLQRRDLSELFDYDEPAAYGEVRYGLTHRATVEGRVEAGEDLVSSDAGVAFQSLLGQFRAIVGGSSADGQFSPALAGSYRYSARGYGVGFSAVRMGAGYTTLSSPPRENAATDLTLAGSLPLGRVGLTLTLTDHREEGRDRRSLGATAMVPLLRSGSLYLSGARVSELGRKAAFEGGFGLTWRLGRHTSAGLQARRSGGREVVGVSMQRSLLQGPGIGYRVNWNEGDQTSSSAAVQYQTDYGRYEVGFDPRDVGGRPTLSASGGLVYIGDRLFVTRTTGQSYALVRVAGLEGVRVLRSNQLVGRTGRGGDLLVPDLLPYYANNISVDDADIPLEYRINSRSVLIAPPARGGALVDFPILRVQSVTGKLIVVSAGEEVIPALGSLRLVTPAGEATSPVGRDGSFWLEDVAPGTHRAFVSSESGDCIFDFTVPLSEDLYLDMGVVSCMN